MMSSISNPSPADGELMIVIADRGWVWVGRVSLDGDWAVVADARCIRRWGTTGGLGQLAAHGPQSATKLDPPHALRVPMRAVIGLVPCEPAAWTA